VSLPSNIQKPRVFLDASTLFAAVFSATGAARMILRLAESGVIELVASSQVIAEVEGALRRKAPEVLGHLALLLDRARCQVAINPTLEQVKAWQSIISYLPDAAVLAAAVATRANYLVTLDRQHFLHNSLLMANPPLPIGTPGDFLAWFRESGHVVASI
jgi:predicted nucleic acid-binding protein